ncbi:MAG: carboxypeptidase-like regulatory domain-containing protein [Vicinamibacterales bacterium]
MANARSLVASVAAVVVAAPALVAAQPAADQARLTGRVTDGSGAALPGVTVTVRPTEGAPTVLVTDGVGQYTSPGLRPGVYQITFELTAFESRTRSAVDLRSGELFILDQQLGLASLEETVQVVAEAPPPPPPPPPPAPPEPPVVLLAPRRPEPVPVAADVLASVCGPGRASDSSLTIGSLVAHRDEPGRRLYGRGDVLVLDVGTDIGLETGQNLVVRRRFHAGDRGRKASQTLSGEQTAGLIQIVETAATTSVAVVVYTCGELFAGDSVEPFDALPMWTAQGLRSPQYDDPAHVILGEHGQTLGAPRQLMVIDRGAAQGAARGQRLTIFRRSLGERGPVIQVADAIIIAVRPESATIRIERASDAVTVGDLVALHR